MESTNVLKESSECHQNAAHVMKTEQTQQKQRAIPEHYQKAEKHAETIIIDGTKAALGRLAAFAAKQSLYGKKIVICNCNEIIIKGKPDSIIRHYNAKIKRGYVFAGPFFPRTADRIVRRTIRGMLPYKKVRGADAFKRIICYNGVPAEYQKKEKKSLKEEKQILNYITIEDLSKLLGK